jgi:hypothetical protein
MRASIGKIARADNREKLFAFLPDQFRQLAHAAGEEVERGLGGRAESESSLGIPACPDLGGASGLHAAAPRNFQPKPGKQSRPSPAKPGNRHPLSASFQHLFSPIGENKCKNISTRDIAVSPLCAVLKPNVQQKPRSILLLFDPA